MTEQPAPPPTILVIDDEKHMHMLLQLCLGRIGARLRFAGNGADALSLCAEGGVDLIVLDYMMPGMNGVETLKKLRTQPQTAHTPVVMLTSRGHADFRAEAEAMGVMHFFTKPFSPAELARTASEYLRRP